MNDWIKCSERSPEKIGRYWCAYEKTDLSERYCSFDYWGGDTWIKQFHGFSIHELPTWWFEFPVPPFPGEQVKEEMNTCDMCGSKITKGRIMKDEIPEGFIRVSDVSSAFCNYGKVPKNILDYAADRGSRVHELVFDLMNNIVVKEERYQFCGKSIKGYIESFDKFWRPLENNSEILMQEERIFSQSEMLTGQIDLLAKIDGKITLIDWKCTRDVGKHWSIQAAGYDHLVGLCENFNTPYICDRTLFVKLDKDGGDPIITEYEPNLDLFYQALEFYKMFFKDQTHNMEMD